jgi:UDP-N-acetylglucosamine transferase subunit ALG13
MILVTTGTNAPPCDRLLREIDEMSLDESVVVQHGPSAIRPAGAKCLDYVPFATFVDLVTEARVVVTHAGVGSILITLMNGKRPVVVPRLARLGEHVDDHQLELGRRLSEIGLVTLVEDLSDLGAALETNQDVSDQVPVPDDRGTLKSDLARYLSTIVNGRS